MKLPYTRAMVRAALSGALDGGAFATDPVFGFEVPVAVAGVPAEVLTPRKTWPRAADYDAQARKLAEMFQANFKDFEAEVPDAVRTAGPHAS